MSTYNVKLSVTVDVEFSIEATSEESVQTLIDNNLIMAAGFVDAHSVDFQVLEDTIESIGVTSISKE